MSRYIDADKLIAEIERRKDKYGTHYINAGRELEELISFTKSLQQEQLHFVDASKMERLNVGILRDWSMKFAPVVRDAVRATAYHFWDLSIYSMKEE